MSIKKYLAITVLAASSCMASAGTIDVVDFSLDTLILPIPFTGSFTGTEDANGNITLSSLTAFDFILGSLQLTDLSAFGTYNAITQTWLENATANGPGQYYFAWSNGNAAIGENVLATAVITSDVATTVPEPASIMLVASGILGIGAKRKQWPSKL